MSPPNQKWTSSSILCSKIFCNEKREGSSFNFYALTLHLTLFQMAFSYATFPPKFKLKMVRKELRQICNSNFVRDTINKHKQQLLDKTFIFQSNCWGKCLALSTFRSTSHYQYFVHDIFIEIKKNIQKILVMFKFTSTYQTTRIYKVTFYLCIITS